MYSSFKRGNNRKTDCVIHREKKNRLRDINKQQIACAFHFHTTARSSWGFPEPVSRAGVKLNLRFAFLIVCLSPSLPFRFSFTDFFGRRPLADSLPIQHVESAAEGVGTTRHDSALHTNLSRATRRSPTARHLSTSIDGRNRLGV